MPELELECLGAGQSVGRSCVIVTILDRRVMFDCGLMMSNNLLGGKKFPDFEYFRSKHPGKTANDLFDAVLITHFHLDHCGALPILTQKEQYSGPLFASTPTKCFLPYMLEDFVRVYQENRDKDSEEELYSNEDIKRCVAKVREIQLGQDVLVKGMTIRAYYAGHVLGACMFYVEYRGLKVVYTGDYNTSADRHLNAAWIDRVQPHMLITETTYASIIRDSKRERERNMLRYVTETLQGGGKVLIPVFALGRAQQLCVLLQTFWARTKRKTPIYFATGMISKANFFYSLFVDWQNERIKDQFHVQNTFNYQHIKPFDKNLIRASSPYVLLAAPGMLHGGTSLQVFKEWCSDPKNAVVIPGHCVSGTFGAKLLAGARQVTIDKQEYQVNLKVYNISFSAHADARGIMGIIRNADPQTVVMVHGEKSRMQEFSKVLKVKNYYPPNHRPCFVPVRPPPVSLLLELFPMDLQFLVRREGETKVVSKEALSKQTGLTLFVVRKTILK